LHLVVGVLMKIMGALVMIDTRTMTAAKRQQEVNAFKDQIDDVDQAHAILNTSTNHEEIGIAIDYIAANTRGVGTGGDSNSEYFKIGYLQSHLAHTNKKLEQAEEIVALVKGLATDGSPRVL